MSRKPTSTIATVGIDPGKNTMHLIGLDTGGAIVLREKVTRDKVVARLANVPPCLIGIEVGMGTHYLTRAICQLGHDARQVPPFYIKPFRQAHKNDFRDAHAVAEAVQRPTTTCVPAKTDEAPGPIPAGRSTDRGYQSNTRLPPRAWYRRAPTPALVASGSTRHPWKASGRLVSADDPHP